jgi:hypothetical protein
MKWELWAPWYRKIVERLNLDEVADVVAAKVLNAILPEPRHQELSEILEGNECIVFGAGPSLEEDLMRLSLGGYLDKVLIAANGATTAVLEYKAPDIVVTDLDGNVESQLEAWRRGAWLVLHAHGDNIPQIEKIAPQIGERVIGTAQIRPFGRLFNFGGFTDGDRAAFMAWELGASRIYLAGMDLGEKIGGYSGGKNARQKLIKLEICGELLSWLASLGANLVNLTAHGKPIPNVISQPV